ncbi:hypothetical protein BU26DRAFT_567881 [Trematosphaeria pertusa]|uniref:Uncharacterized protein n=1 Tax=Trematosphaeria pertusa TaxID=390896 RepID=A0A6A6I4P4_9PLEO|nr:uncharacterized protein BU26DRAFT_567881 [Trematosphaeria pertusa]KAF2245287.1 hypothetical protein BU26DRAFT_567881 [Trematosphaeria pertusa]
MIDECFYDPPELIPLYAQTPKTRCIDIDEAPPRYALSIQESQPSPALTPRGLHCRWKLAGKIFTKRRGMHEFRYKESTPLLRAYRYSLQLGERGAEFRTALVDAMAEVIDDYGMVWFP